MKNIVLIGMMGSGKTAIGATLSEKLHRPFIDTDQIIEKREKKTIANIFELYGESYFRKLEEEVVKEISKYDNYIIATGGGIILHDENINYLKQNGDIIYLKNDIDELVNRLQVQKEQRPLISNGDLHSKISTLMKNRESLYEKSADWIIKNKDFNQTVNEILKLNLYEKQGD